MNRTTWLQDRRMKKFCDVLSRWKARELSAQEAGEILGCSERRPSSAGSVSRPCELQRRDFLVSHVISAQTLDKNIPKISTITQIGSGR